jgi:hypothetical protein
MAANGQEIVARGADVIRRAAAPNSALCTQVATKRRRPRTGRLSVQAVTNVPAEYI